MRRHGSYRRKGRISEALPLVHEPLPKVLRDESNSPALPLVSESEALPLTTGDGEALPLMHGEVDFGPVIDEGDYIDPINPEPLNN